MSEQGAKTALVTGASRGIGRAVAIRLARDGMRVGVHYGNSAQGAAATVAAIEAAGGTAFPVQARLDQPSGVAQLWARFDEHADGLDVLVNNAAVLGRRHGFADVEAAELDDVFAVNVRAPFLLTQAALPRLRDRGRIVNVSTTFTHGAANPDLLPYTMSKAAIDAFTATLAKQLGERGITVNAVGPGAVATDMNADSLATPEDRALIAATSPLDRVAEPEDIADVVAFLASEDARWITGQWIDASGGSLL
ncbi:MAG: SDR family oxidoreductase [Nocardioides sp.]|uniref:SDR family oxidoreductase n=1 Tax=Nocardioides sp. TaxID=35761 RepID=UPI0039E4716C